MKSYDSLIKALRYCASDETDCKENCPYSFTTECLGKIKQDAAAAIEELQALLKEADKKQAYQHDYVCELVAEVEELKAAQPHWVSVFDDLPRHNAVVVVSDGKRSWDVGQYHFLVDADDRTRWWWKKHTTRKVLWWMYKEDALPEPPQGVQE